MNFNEFLLSHVLCVWGFSFYQCDEHISSLYGGSLLNRWPCTSFFRAFQLELLRLQPINLVRKLKNIYLFV
jgi:hypothetical protein